MLAISMELKLKLYELCYIIEVMEKHLKRLKAETGGRKSKPKLVPTGMALSEIEMLVHKLNRFRDHI